jgi:hypothetical protein
MVSWDAPEVAGASDRDIVDAALARLRARAVMISHGDS